jgi:hypothetical protein
LAEVSAIRACALPEAALLRRCLNSGAYADCFVAEVAATVSQAEFIEAFYTTWLFKIERLLLGWFVARRSSDLQAKALADGSATSFAAWTVEGRTPDQLLMCDFMARTRSWLMIAASPNTGGTLLYFGSAVVPELDARTGERKMGKGFRALLGFHKLYSRALLWLGSRRVLSLSKA